MNKLMIYGPSIDLNITITDDNAEKVYYYLVGQGIVKENE